MPAEDANDTEIAVFMALTWTAWWDCRERLKGLAPSMSTKPLEANDPPASDPLGLAS